MVSQRSFLFRTDQLLRVALILWVAYFSVLAFVDWWLVDRDAAVLLYYAVQIANSLFIFGLTFLPWQQAWKEKVILPVLLTLMAALPTVTVHVMVRIESSQSLHSPDGMTLRLTPILLIGLLLTAWHYRWPTVVLFGLSVAVLNLVGIFIWPIIDGVMPRFRSQAVLVTGIQTISLLMVGYMTSALMSRLREQQRSLEEANVQLRDYASAQIELTISHERNRMARELHDTLAHTLSGLSVQLQTVKAYWDLDPPASQKMLDEALVATRSGLQETRYALKSLRAIPLDDLGLSLAIRQLAEAAAARANLKLHLAIPESLSSLAPETSQCLYRVAQEAIMNVVYHAAAQNLSVTIHESVSIHENRKEIELTVKDDGIGFDPNGVHLNHWGVTGMHERAQLMGGLLLIESEIDGGTTVNLLLPEKQL